MRRDFSDSTTELGRFCRENDPTETHVDPPDNQGGGTASSNDLQGEDTKGDYVYPPTETYG